MPAEWLRQAFPRHGARPVLRCALGQPAPPTCHTREGLVLVVPMQSPEDYDALLDMDEDEPAEESKAAIEAFLAAAHGTNTPKEGTVTCLATDRSSSPHASSSAGARPQGTVDAAGDVEGLAALRFPPWTNHPQWICGRLDGGS
ncbi:hypothetical protein GCM10027200_33340 [Lentzea nigeriaca]